MSNAAASFLGQFPVTAPDVAITRSPGGIAADANTIMTETLSEAQNLQQDLGNRLVEIPGSNPDFGDRNTRGVGVMRYCSAPAEDLDKIAVEIDTEFEQDPRVNSSATSVTTNADGSRTIATEVDTIAGIFGLSWNWSLQGVVPMPITTGTTGGA